MKFARYGILALFVSVSTWVSAHAGTTVQLTNAEAIFEAAKAAFPEAVEHVGNGFTEEIYVQQLNCVSNLDQAQCFVLTFEDKEIQLSSDDGPDADQRVTALWKALVAGGIHPLKGNEEADFSLSRFEAARIEPKASSPNDQVTVNYKASYEE